MCATILKLGDIQLGGFDGGILTDIAWKLHLGYHPYRDVVAPGMPPLFLLGSKWAFDLFGARWHAFVLLTACFSVLTFFVHCSLLARLKLGVIWSTLLALMTQSVTIIPLCWWWYNQLTTIIAALFITAAFLFIRDPHHRGTRYTLVTMTVLLLFTKANVAGVLLFSTAIIFLLTGYLRTYTLPLFAAAGGIATLALMLFGINPLELLASYQVGSTRALSVSNFLHFLLHYDFSIDSTYGFLTLAGGIFLLCLSSIVRATRRSGASHREGTAPDPVLIPTLCMAWAGLLTAFVAVGTNGEIKVVEAPIALLSFIIPILLTRKLQHKMLFLPASLFLMLCTAFFIIIGFQYGVTRERIMTIGVGEFYQDTRLTVLRQPSFFQGMAVSPHFLQVLAQVQAVFRANPALTRDHLPVHFGPRIQFFDAAFRLHPPKGIPSWWEFYQCENARTAGYVHRFADAHVKVAIFLLHDETFYPQSLRQYFHEHFHEYDWHDLSIFVSNDYNNRFVVPTLDATARGQTDH